MHSAMAAQREKQQVQESIRLMRDGDAPCVVTISGFLNEERGRDEETTAWRRVPEVFPGRAWAHLYWMSQDRRTLMQRLGLAALCLLGPAGSLPFVGGLGMRLAMSAAASTRAASVWVDALAHSRQAARSLHAALALGAHGEYVVLGHSLGGRVAFELLRLHAADPGAYALAEVHLLGAALGADPGKWDFLGASPATRIYNYYSRNDFVLRRLYKLGTLGSRAMGARPVGVPGVTDVDVTDLVGDHSEYMARLDDILGREG